MKQQCPGCRDLTRDVRCEGGKAVYCTQCGRGYRFIYGFVHRYLYFVFNHPALTYLILLLFAMMHSASFPGRARVFYLLFFSGVYWIGLNWVRRSQRYLEPLPTGPNAPPVEPRAVAPAPPRAGATPTPQRTKPRRSWLAILALIANLLVFPVALAAGLASLPIATGVGLDLAHLGGEGSHLIATAEDVGLHEFRAGFMIYAVVAGLIVAGLLTLTLIASFAARRPGRSGREATVWAGAFLLVSALLFTSQIVSGMNVLRDWRTQARVVRDVTRGTATAGGADVHRFAEDPLYHWTLLHAWRDEAPDTQALLFFERTIEGRVEGQATSGRPWLSRGLAMRLASDRTREIVRRWPRIEARQREKVAAQVDACAVAMLTESRDGTDPALRRAALTALTRLRSVPFALPRAGAMLADIAFGEQWPDDVRRRIVSVGDLGADRVLANRAITRLATGAADSEEAQARCAIVLRAAKDRAAIVDALERVYDDGDLDVRRRVGRIACRLAGRSSAEGTRRLVSLLSRIHRDDPTNVTTSDLVTAAGKLSSRDTLPWLLDGIRQGGITRARANYALYRTYNVRGLSRTLRSKRRHYYRTPTSLDNWDDRRIRLDEAVAGEWLREIRRRPERFAPTVR